MQFDPDKHTGKLQEALNSLRRVYNLTSGALIVEMAAANRSRTTKYKILSRDTLDRFKKTGRTRYITHLSDVWEFLDSNKNYRVHISGPSESHSDLSPSVELSMALARFFSKDETVTHTYSPEFIRKKLPGSYILYMPDPMPGAPKGRFRAVEANIIDNGTGLSILQTQDFQKSEKQSKYFQEDVGEIFTYGRYVLYILKELTGTCVHFGVLDTIFSVSGSQPAEWLEGTLFAASQLKIFPPIRILFYRLEEEEDPNKHTGLVQIDDVPIVDARLHLKSMFPET